MDSSSLAHYSNDGTKRDLRRAIARERDRLLELDRLVDLQGSALGAQCRTWNVDDLRDAGRERNRAAVHLERLIAWYVELEADYSEQGRA